MDYQKNSSFGVKLRYGFANTNFAPGIDGYKTIDPMHALGIGFKAGRFIEQYNASKPINGLINAAYTLIDRQNFMKIYQKEVLSVYVDYELVNGLYARLNTQYFQREAMVNHTDYSFAKKDKPFSSNNPLNAANDAAAFTQHQGMETGISFRYRHKQKYESMPGYKNVIGSKYPELYFTYKAGFGTRDLSYHYNYAELGIGKDIDLNGFGEFKFDVTAGSFFTKKNMQFIDYKHFNGNQTLFITNSGGQFNTAVWGRTRLNGFHALDYYTYSTASSFVELHLLHNFRGLLISKIPLVRKMKAREIAGINSLQTEVLNYNELYFGLTHIFSFLNVDAGTASNSKTGTIGWFYRIGINIDL